MSSCNHDDVLSHDDNNIRLTLTLGRQISMGTRATDNGVDVLNENLINNVDVFFYKEDAAITDEPIYSLTEIQLPDNTKGTAQIDITMPISKYNELFPTENDVKCLVYAIVNRPTSHSGDNSLPVSRSIASLKDNTILYAEKFAQRNEDPMTHHYSPSVQDNFVMDGMATIVRSGSELTGSIPVERVAAKISLFIDGVAKEVEDDGVTWVSDKNSIRLSLRRGSKRTKLGSTPTEYIYGADKDNDLFRLDAISLDATDGEIMTTSIPFYTYPTNWSNDENSRTHFILVVEWTKKDNPSEKLTTYYEVNVNASGSYTERNYHYVIRQEISVLGSKEEETPVVLTPSSYVILDWGNSSSDADLSRFKYLVVDETYVEMHNITNKQILFFSSDPIDLSDATIQWEYLGDDSSQILTFATMDNQTKKIDSVTGDILYEFSNTASVENVKNRIQGDYKVMLRIHNVNSYIVGDRGYITIEHRLNNSMTKDADYTEYTMTLKVQHQNESKYNETIKVIQYPMIAVKAEANSKPTNNGGVWVNKNTSNSSNNYGGVHGLTGSNKNPNRYIISVSALNEGSTYIIGDPRKSTVDNLSTNFQVASTMKYSGDGNDRRLTYYHPTIENYLTANMISPQFMIASSYGVTLDINKDNARRRCASYQEDGYPAGRWRLPTQAEIEYIVRLSAWKIIPTLFGDLDGGTTNYWSANGGVAVNTGEGTVSSTTMSSGPVRCVYDTWYWTDKCTKTQFTWGDKADF